ncbi:hypothetical protein PoB_003026900 [Plakobranchus ocellatus]|uniref:Uncharacterized protein n=1 Tax=Plakobranchus ocellatus TaxID=259542 RepID=A0AAV4ABZ0_9GAST|nr:hypothetical protein PoB_003026900 [Plakobranchus ocellatus]
MDTPQPKITLRIKRWARNRTISLPIGDEGGPSKICRDPSIAGSTPASQCPGLTKAVQSWDHLVVDWLCTKILNQILQY